MSTRRSLPPSHFLTPAAGHFERLREVKRALAHQHLSRAPHHHTCMGRSATDPTPASNVVGVGIGEKLVSGRPTGVLAVKFLVRLKYPHDQVPESDRLPSDLGGLPVDVEQVGTFRRLAAPAPGTGKSKGKAKPAPPSPVPAAPNPRIRLRPAQPGCSVGFIEAGNPVAVAGTFGYLAADGDKRYIISNNHVLANENRLAIGGPILQPGFLDGGNPETDWFANLVRFSPLSTTDPNTVDCALAELVAGQKALSDVLFLGAPQGTAPAAIDMVVHKFGRTTGYRVGRITSVDTDLSVDYGLGPVTFHGQILIQGLGGHPFSDSGDSGAAVIERATGKAVGLLFAGSSSHSAANHIDDVLAALDVRLA
jgi:hypothetical protein